MIGRHSDLKCDSHHTRVVEEAVQTKDSYKKNKFKFVIYFVKRTTE